MIGDRGHSAVAGALIETDGEIDHGTVVLMIDLPPDEHPWLSAHPTAEWVGKQLRLGKRPISWMYRPTVIEPDQAEFLEQVGVEFDVSKAHLRSTLNDGPVDDEG